MFAGHLFKIQGILKKKIKKEEVNSKVIRKKVVCTRTRYQMIHLIIYKFSNYIMKKMIQIKDKLIKKKKNRFAVITIMIVFKF